MRLLTIALATTGMFVVAPVSLAAQHPVSGTRVRISFKASEANRLVGSLVRLDRDSIVIADPRAATIASDLPTLRRLEISRGRHSHARLGALIGGLGGAVAGAISVGALCGDSCVGATPIFLLPVGTALVRAGIGAVVGALI